ncbi:unnamed protein product [Aphanomyces euteiches]
MTQAWRPLYLRRRLRDAQSNGNVEVSCDIVKSTSSPPRSNVRRLLDLIWLEWPKLCCGIVGLSVSSITNLLFPKVLGAALDVACGRPPPRGMSHKTFFLTILSIFVSGATASFVRVYCLGSVAEATAKRLRNQLYAAYLAQPMQFFTSYERTALVHRITDECQTAADAVINIIADGYRSLNSSIGASIMLFRLSPTLTLVSLSTIPFVATGAMTFRMYLKTLERRYDDVLASLRASVDEKIGGIQTVKLCTQEDNEIQAFAVHADAVAASGRRAKAAEGLFMGGLSFCTNVSLAGVLWVGGSIIGSGALTTGELTSFMMYSGFMSLGFAQLATMVSKFRATNEATKVLFDLFDQPVPPAATSTLENVQGAVDFQKVTFGYPNQPALFRDFTWHVPAGASVALVGSSGAGKSTVASLLTRLFEVKGGHISLDGVDISTLDTTALRKYIGLVQQEANIFSGTILSNIKYANPTADYDEATAMASLTSIDDFSSTMPQGYDSPVVPSSLSGGQKQRLALVRALLAKPKVLVLDEATVALDGNTEERILQAVKSKQTTIVIAHRLSTIRSCDSIAVLHEGSIVEEGTFDELNREGTVFRSLLASHAIESNE